MNITTNSTPPAAQIELHTFLLNHIKTKAPHGHTIEWLELAHNDVWVLRQLIADSAAREQQLTDALQACVNFAAMRRQELGTLSPEMEAVDAQACAALAGSAA